MKAALLITSGLFLLAAFAGQPQPAPVAQAYATPDMAAIDLLRADLETMKGRLATADAQLTAANVSHAQQLADLNAKLTAAKTPPQPPTQPQAVAYGGSCASGSCSSGSRYVSSSSGGTRQGVFGRIRARRGR